jgi:alcohol dehydrogenase
MLAAVLERAGVALRVEERPAPVLHAGGAIVRVEAVQVLPFSRAVFAGAFPFPLPTPYTPGSSAIGFVEAVADDVSGLVAGTRVYCDPYLTCDAPGSDVAPMLIGWFALGSSAARAQAIWHDGSFAEQVCWPATRCVPLTGLERIEAGLLAAFNYLSIAYGALLRAELRPSQSVIVTGATGNLGAATVLVALAMGASRVVAAGRNEQVLTDLVAVDPRIRPVQLCTDREADTGAMREAASIGTATGAHALVDAVGLTDTTEHVLAGLDALSPGGMAVLAGGVSAAIPLDYQALLGRQLTVRGSFMAPTTAVLG